jgi:hypothetical protein
MVKKDKRIDNPLFENTTGSRGVAIKTKRSRQREKKGDDDALSRSKDVKEPVVESPQTEKPVAPAIEKKDGVSSEKPDAGKSVDELMKIKDNLKGRLAKMEKESEDLAEVHKRFVFVNRFEESAEVEELESDGDVVAEWGKIDSAEDGEEPALDGKGDIFHVIRELEQELDTTSVLNKSLDAPSTMTSRTGYARSTSPRSSPRSCSRSSRCPRRKRTRPSSARPTSRPSSNTSSPRNATSSPRSTRRR